MSRRHVLLSSAMLLAAASLAPASSAEPAERLDPRPRTVVMSAFPPELTALAGRTEIERKASVNGVEITLGRLAGQDVALVLSGIIPAVGSPDGCPALGLTDGTGPSRVTEAGIRHGHPLRGRGAGRCRPRPRLRPRTRRTRRSAPPGRRGPPSGRTARSGPSGRSRPAP